MIDARSIQAALRECGYDPGPIDGIMGSRTEAAIAALLASLSPGSRGWSAERQLIGINQWLMRRSGISDVGELDGFMGPQTRYALERWQGLQRDIDPHPSMIEHQSEAWPRQRDMRDFYGAPGEGHTLLALPYPMRLAWDKSTTIRRISIHGKCAPSAERALKAALDHYGRDGLCEFGLDLFGGCYANRKMRGGSRLSTHAFAAALDINPEANRLRWGSDRAAMAKPECAAFLDAFEAEGWVSLGRERNFDWMHVQAARL